MNSVTMHQRVAIGSFIRQQRLASSPGQFSHVVNRARSRKYLTQEEVADLAGLSETSIAQVESGRYPNINPGLIRRIAQALHMPPNQERYLLNFLMVPPGSSELLQDGLSPAACSVVDNAQPSPALIIDYRFDILYWNLAAINLLGDFSQVPLRERNVLWSMFCDPEMRTRWVDWETNARNLVGGFRMQVSLHPHHREDFDDLIERLSSADELFRKWWSSEDPSLNPLREKDYLHPNHGLMKLYQTVSTVLGAPKVSLIVYTPRDAATRKMLESSAGVEGGGALSVNAG